MHMQRSSRNAYGVISLYVIVSSYSNKYKRRRLGNICTFLGALNKANLHIAVSWICFTYLRWIYECMIYSWRVSYVSLFCNVILTSILSDSIADYNM